VASIGMPMAFRHRRLLAGQGHVGILVLPLVRAIRLHGCIVEFQRRRVVELEQR
jgi:hypothetical protein